MPDAPLPQRTGSGTAAARRRSRVTNGASSDLENVTRIARTMVTRWGMSPKLGPRVFGQKEELVFLGREIGEQRDYSESVAETIDEEVHEIVSTAYERALEVLRENREMMYQFDYDYRFDGSKAEAFLGRAPTSYSDGIAACLSRSS